MKKIFMLQAVLVLALVLFRPSEAEASVTELGDGIWVEEGEAVFYETSEEISEISLAADDGDSYSAYDFEKPFTFYSEDDNGNTLEIFTMAVTGTVYFYESGKVHLLRCDSKKISTIRSSYKITKYYPKITNTDGSYSEGLVLFFTYDSVYPCGDFAMKVYFQSGSTQTYGSFTVVQLRGQYS